MHHNDALTDNINDKTEEVVGLRDKLDEIKDSQCRFEKTCVFLYFDIVVRVEMDRKLRQINFKLDDVKEKKLQLEDENGKKEEIIKRADDRLQDVRSELQEYQNEAAQLENQIAAKDEQIRWLKGRVDAMTQEKNDIEVTVLPFAYTFQHLY